MTEHLILSENNDLWYVLQFRLKNIVDTLLYKSSFDCSIFQLNSQKSVVSVPMFKIGLKLQRWVRRGQKWLIESAVIVNWWDLAQRSHFIVLWGSEEKCLDICESSSCDMEHVWITLLLVFSAGWLPRPGFLEYNRKLGPIPPRTRYVPLIGQFILTTSSDWLIATLPTQCGDSCCGCQERREAPPSSLISLNLTWTGSNSGPSSLERGGNLDEKGETLLLACSKDSFVTKSDKNQWSLSLSLWWTHLIKRLPALMIRRQIAEIGGLALNGIPSPRTKQRLTEFHNILSLYFSLSSSRVLLGGSAETIIE